MYVYRDVSSSVCQHSVSPVVVVVVAVTTTAAMKTDAE